MNPPLDLPSLTPSGDKKTLRRQLLAERQTLVDRHRRAMHLQEVLRVWLASRPETAIGAYWPIKGEFDALPALFRWSEASETHRIGLPVVNRETGELRFHAWYPGCEMEADAYGIPKPRNTPSFEPGLLLVPCVGYGPAPWPSFSRGPSPWAWPTATASCRGCRPSRTTSRWTPSSTRTAWPGSVKAGDRAQAQNR
jgi:hypothetical protein